MTRRVAVLAVAVLLLAAGCTGSDDTATYRASPAAVENATVASAGYDTAGPRNLSTNDTFTVGNDTRHVKFTHYVTSYVKNGSADADGAPLALFTVISSPRIDVLGTSINPLGSMNHSQLIGAFESNATGITVGDRVDNRTITVLGNATNVSKFEGRIELDNASNGSNVTVDVYFHVARFEDGDDHLVVYAAYPRSAPGEEEAVLAMLRALDHPVDASD